MKTLARVVRAISEAIFPVRCPMCRSFFLDTVGQTGTGDASMSAAFLCPKCMVQLTPISPPVCKCCGAVFESPEGEDHLCQPCILIQRPFQMARAAGVYDRALMTVIHQFKYQGKIGLARPLGNMLFETYLNVFKGNGVDLIIPVPLHLRRFRQRGFNQAYLLVRDWKRRYETVPPVVKDVLFRRRWTRPQTGLGRKERIRNIKKAFAVENTPKIEGKNILLIDDVYTTGATVGECARVLRKSGAKRVDVLTLARAR